MAICIARFCLAEYSILFWLFSEILTKDRAAVTSKIAIIDSITANWALI